MGILTLTNFISLDGVVQAPGGATEDTDGGFKSGGWVMPLFDEEAGSAIVEIYSRVEAFLLGRRTYDIFAGHWPKVTDKDDPIAGSLNKLPKYVASRSARKLEWANSHLVRDVPAEIAALKKKIGGELQLHGSGNLAQTLIAHDLIDEYNLFVFPVMTGPGKRLFGESSKPGSMELVKSITTPNGVIVATYRRNGALKTQEAPPPE